MTTERVTNQHRPWSKVHRDFKTVIDGERHVLVNENGAAVLVKWVGPTK